MCPDGFAIIEEVKHLYDKEKYKSDEICDLVSLLLMRVRCESPHVYAMSVGQFPGYDEIEAFLDQHGYHDTEGFMWMAPKTFGPYLEKKVREA